MAASASRTFVALAALLAAALLGACASTGRGGAETAPATATVTPPPAANGKSVAASPTPAPPAAMVAPAPAPLADEVPASDSIFFADDKKTIDARDRDLLRRHVARLKDNPRLVLTLVAHTPGQGSHSYNLALAGDWLEEVIKVMRAAGVPRKQLRKEHARRPRDTPNCTTNACRQQLRRVDLVYR